jgi:thiamine biosynthesis protein ThiS
MEIFVNGEKQQVAENYKIINLIQDLKLENKRLAVEVNLTIIPRSQFETYLLSVGDKIEIIQAIGGG